MEGLVQDLELAGVDGARVFEPLHQLFYLKIALLDFVVHLSLEPLKLFQLFLELFILGLDQPL